MQHCQYPDQVSEFREWNVYPGFRGTASLFGASNLRPHDAHFGTAMPTHELQRGQRNPKDTYPMTHSMATTATTAIPVTSHTPASGIPSSGTMRLIPSAAKGIMGRRITRLRQDVMRLISTCSCLVGRKRSLTSTPSRSWRGNYRSPTSRISDGKTPCTTFLMKGVLASVYPSRSFL